MKNRVGVHDIGIVGCGTAGPAAALFFARAGHRVTLYERFAAPSAVGAGIMLQPTGQAVLARLGLHDAVVSRGARIDRLRCETASRRTVLDLKYERLGSDLFGVGLHRGVLFETLYGALLCEDISLRLGVAAVGLARIRGERRRFIKDAHGDLYGPHDLIVVADGARSELRDDTDTHLSKSVRTYPWGALWFVADDHDRSFTGELYQVVDGTRRLLGLLPTGLGPSHATAGPKVSIFWSVRGTTVDAVRAAGIDAWKREVLRLAPQAAVVLGQVESIDQLLYATYNDVDMPRWHTHDVVYIGDAAHAMSPQLGQGCNLALCDAMILAECVARAHDIPRALAAYSSAREAHVRFYQFATRWLTPFFQSDATPLGLLRDVLMGPASRIPYVAREMVASMGGVKEGLLFGRHPLATR